MCSIKSGISNGKISNKENKKAGTSSLNDAFAMLEKPKRSLSDWSLSSDSSETSEMAALLEAAVTSPPPKPTALLEATVTAPPEEIEKKKLPKIKIIKQDKNKAQILTPLMIPSNDSAKKRFANKATPAVNNELAAKRAKIMSALTAPSKPSVEVRRPGSSSGSPASVSKGPSTFTPSRPAKRVPLPVQPVGVKPAATNATSLAGGRSSIHGRKMMSIREQQEQMNKKNISEFVLRLKAETEREKTTQKPNRRQETSQRRTFGSIQSVSRLPFALDDDDNSTEIKA